MQLGLAHNALGSTARALEVLAAIDREPVEPVLWASALFHRAHALRLDRRSSEARALLERIVAKGPDAPLYRRARLTLASLQVITDPVRADRALAEIEDDALLAHDQPRLLFARAWRGTARWAVSDLDEAILLLESAASLARSMGYGVPQVEIGGMLAGAEAARGRIEAARERLIPLLQQASGKLLATASLWSCFVEALAGDADAAADAASRVRSCMPATAGTQGEALHILLDALLPFARDRADPRVAEPLARLRLPGEEGRGSAWDELPTVALIGETLRALIPCRD